MANWYLQNGKESDVVVSSRVRLSRNLNGFNFLNRCSKEKQEEILEKIKEIVPSLGYGLKFIKVDDLDEVTKLSLVEKNLITDTIGLYIGYSKNIINSTGGSMKLTNYTNTYSDLMAYFLKLYDSTTNKTVPIRRIGVSFNRLVSDEAQQLSLFENQEKITKERKIELAISNIKQKLGKNAIIKGMDLENGATTILRNKLIGGHNAYD